MADVDGGSEVASRAPVTLRKSPMEMERLVAGEGSPRRAEADVDGGSGARGDEEEEEEGEGASGGWGYSIAGAMSSLVSS